MRLSGKPLLVAVLALATAPLCAQDKTPLQKQRTTTTQTTSKTQILKVSNLMKSEILIQEDQSAGQVVDFVVSDGGCIEYLVASYEEQYYLIPYSAVDWRYDDSVVFIDMTPKQFSNVQFFATNAWPDIWASSYQQQVYTTFGVRSARREGNATFKSNRAGSDDKNPGERDREDKAGDSKNRKPDDSPKNPKNRPNELDNDPVDRSPSDDQPAAKTKPSTDPKKPVPKNPSSTNPEAPKTTPPAKDPKAPPKPQPEPPKKEPKN